MSIVAVMFCRMVFCLIVTKVQLARSPVYPQLFQCLAVSQPVEPHIHRLCALGLYFVVYYPFSCRVISLDQRWRLRMPHLLEYLSNVYRLACANE